MPYRIRYQHTSTQHVPSLRAALRAVRSEAGVSRLRRADCSDGLYLWTDTEAMRRDTDGSRAYVVIESPAQQEAHS